MNSTRTAHFTLRDPQTTACRRAMPAAAVLWLACVASLWGDDPLRGRGGEADGPLTYEGQPLEHWSRIARRELHNKTREPAYSALMEFAQRDESRDAAVVALRGALETESSTSLLSTAYRALALAGTPAANQVVRAALAGEQNRERRAALSALSRPLTQVSVSTLEDLLPELLMLLQLPDAAERELALQGITHGLLDYMARNPIPADAAEDRARLTRILTPAMQLLLGGLDDPARESNSLSAIALMRMSLAGADLSSLRPALEERLRTQLLEFNPQAVVSSAAPEVTSDPRTVSRGSRSADPVMSPQVRALAVTAALFQRVGGDMAPAIEMLHRAVDQIPDGRNARQSLEQLIILLERGEFLTSSATASSATSSRSNSGFSVPYGPNSSVEAGLDRLRQRGASEQEIEAARQQVEELQQRFRDRGGFAIDSF